MTVASEVAEETLQLFEATADVPSRIPAVALTATENGASRRRRGGELGEVGVKPDALDATDVEW